MIIAEGSKVSIEYTLSLEDEKDVDSNVRGEPLTYVHGKRNIVPGLEKGLEGLKAGDTKQVEVLAKDGYGPLNDKAFVEVPVDEIPEEARKVGATLQAENPTGEMVYPVVKEVKDDTLILDFNHPLAGKTLLFDVKILDVQAGTVETAETA